MAFVDFEGFQNQESGGSPTPLQLTNVKKATAYARQFPLWVYWDRLREIIGRGLARFLSRYDKRAEDLIRNWDPRTAEELLADWERLYQITPDPGSTIEDRRELVLARVRALGGSTAAYYEAVAADFGYGDAVVTDAGFPATCNGTCNQQLLGGEWLLVFTVTAASQGAVRDNDLQNLINRQLLAGWLAVYDFT